MNTHISWFESDDDLVQALRRTRPAPSAPPVIAGYGDLRELRRGGQGVVYLATQSSTRQRVAIKIVLDGALASREARRRFEREIDLVAGLRHPNVVRVYDSGTTGDGRLYCVMEYIDGAGLDELIDAASQNASPNWVLGAAEATLATFAKICDGVQHAHQRGIVHRDLKPSNVRIDPQGEPHVLDFGLAKLTDSGPETTQMSRTGSFMGSLPWASPEQADGSPGRTDVRSDVYSLGVILYQLLTGRFPYPVDGSLRTALDSILTTPPIPPREIRRDLSDELSTIVLKCLAKEPERRYQSAGELARDVRRYQAGEPIEAKRDSAWYAVRKKMSRYKTALRASAALLVASLAFGAIMVWLWSRATKAEMLAANRLADVQAANLAEVEARRSLERQVHKTDKVRDFLDSTLRAVDPWKHPGRDLGPLREMLDAARQRLRGAFPDQPEVEAAIAGTLGYDYGTLGLYESAEHLLRRAYELYSAALGPESDKTLQARNSLAQLLTERSEHEEAARLLQEQLEIQIRILGPEHPRTLITMNNLALDLDWQGRSVEAEALYRQALEAQTRRFGPDDAERLSTLNNLALCLPALGRNEEALQLLQQAAERYSAKLGAGHPEALRARMNLAGEISRMGRPNEAEAQMAAVLRDMESTLGPGHPLTIAGMHNLSSIVASLGRNLEALDLTRQSYERAVAFAGAHHPTALLRMHDYVTSLIELRRWEEAIPLSAKLQEQFSLSFGELDWRTLTVAGNLAYALNQVGEREAAETTWRDLIAAEPQVGSVAESIVTAKANLGALLADLGRWDAAEAMLRDAIGAQHRRNEDDHFRTAIMRVSLGRVLTETKRFPEARGELLFSYCVLSDVLGDDHDRTQRAVRALVRLFEESGDAQSAEEFRRKLSAALPGE